MEFTGERVVPGQTDPDLMNEHWARYSFAEALVRSKRVLDAGCGAGYGAARLAASARQVVALDSALEPLLDGAAKYKSRGLSFLRGDCARLPFRDESFEAVVAFEVIEHLEEWALLIREAGRVLIPGGQLIISTPNRIYYGDSRVEPNPYHVHEFDHGEFREALGEVFPHVEMFLENHADTVVFSPREARGVRTRVEETKSEPEEAHFFLAVCSKRPLHGSPAFVYVPRTANVLRERERHIALLRSEVRQKESWLASTTRDLEKLTVIHVKAQKQAQEDIDGLQAENLHKTELLRSEVRQKESWLASTTRDLEKLTVIHVEAQKQAQEDIDGLQAENLHKTEWARELETEIARLNGELKKCIALIDDAEKQAQEDIDGLQAENLHKTEWARELETEIARLNGELKKCIALIDDAEKQAQEDIDGLQAENLHKTEWARELETEIARLNGELKKCIALIDDAEQRVIERTEWAQRFERELDGIYRSKVFKISRRLGLTPSPSRDPDGSRG